MLAPLPRPNPQAPQPPHSHPPTHTPAQDLELWITKEEVEYGFNLAVRAGRVVQEVRVATGMSADEMRAAVQRVLRSIN